MEIKRWNSFSPTNASQRRKARLLKLNRQTACPPRTAVPVNQGCRISSFTHGIRFAFGHGGDYPSYVAFFYPLDPLRATGKILTVRMADILSLMQIRLPAVAKNDFLHPIDAYT